MNCFRVDYCGRGELADRQQKLNQFLSKLAHMAEGKPISSERNRTDTVLEFNICVLMVQGEKATSEQQWADNEGRQIKSKAIPEPMHYSPAPTAVNLSVDIF